MRPVHLPTPSGRPPVHVILQRIGIYSLTFHRRTERYAHGRRGRQAASGRFSLQFLRLLIRAGTSRGSSRRQKPRPSVAILANVCSWRLRLTLLSFLLSDFACKLFTPWTRRGMTAHSKSYTTGLVGALHIHVALSYLMVTTSFARSA